MKGLFIPGITAETLRNGCLEAIEALMVEGEIYDIDYDFKEREPCADTISRQAALDAVFNNTESPNKAYKAIRLLPSAQPEPCEDTISRQAAIDALFELYEYQRNIDPTEAADLVRQGIYLAEKKIEQLPSAQPETYEDAVSRQAVLDAINNPLNVRLDVIIKNLPSVTQKPRIGKWLINSDGYYPYCSECKAEPKSGEMTDYCPKCGAKMEGFAK